MNPKLKQEQTERTETEKISVSSVTYCSIRSNLRDWHWPEEYSQHLFFPNHAHQFVQCTVYITISTNRMI